MSCYIFVFDFSTSVISFYSIDLTFGTSRNSLTSLGFLEAIHIRPLIKCDKCT